MRCCRIAPHRNNQKCPEFGDHNRCILMACRTFNYLSEKWVTALLNETQMVQHEAGCSIVWKSSCEVRLSETKNRSRTEILLFCGGYTNVQSMT